MQAKSQNTKTMAQETLKSLIAVMLTLSVAEQEQVIAEMQKNFALRYPYEQSALCGMVTWAYDGPDQALTRDEYEDLVELPFEDHLFYATSAWDKNLSGIFGDYMQLPPEAERITHNLEAYRL